jgi:hypothetical protein
MNPGNNLSSKGHEGLNGEARSRWTMLLSAGDINQHMSRQPEGSLTDLIFGQRTLNPTQRNTESDADRHARICAILRAALEIIDSDDDDLLNLPTAGSRNHRGSPRD